MSETGERITRIYSNFRGVDFRGEEINIVRSPDSLNVWKDYKHTDSIRTRPCMEAVSGGMGNIHSFTLYEGDLIVHHGTNLDRFQPYPPYRKLNALGDNLADNDSVMFVNGEYLYIIDGEKYLRTNGRLKAEEVVGYVPTTSIARKVTAEGDVGGGTIYEDVNMIQPRRKNTFVGNDIDKCCYLDRQNLDTDFVPIVKVNGKNRTDFTVDYAQGLIKITGDAPPSPKTDGQDNIEIEFKKTVDGYRSNVENCTLATVFDNRVFVSGNSNHPNYVWHCSLLDPTYFSDLDYYQEGLDDAAVKGMVAGNNALWVFREPSIENTTVFYHTPTIDAEYGKVYPSTHSSITIGCVGKAINFNDDIVFFSNRGMEGISGDVTTEQMAAHRSSLVDRKMLAEPNYRNMVLAEWEGYLIVFIGNKAFLADSRTMVTVDNHYEYEWFYWEMEEEITSAITHDGVLYLGTNDGIYTLTDNTSPIESYWVTPKDKFKAPHMQKTTNKRGCVGEATGDITVYAKTEKTEFEYIGEYTDIQDCFVSRIKRKKFKDIQLKFHSNTRFSLESVTLEAWIGGYIKR